MHALTSHQPPPSRRLERKDLDQRGTRALATMAALPPHHRDRAAVRARVIEMHLPLAQRLARRYHRGGEPFDDLFQVAAEGLIKAVDGFDPRRGGTFIPYAVPTILGELKRYFRDLSWDVRAPRRIQELYLQVRDAAEELTQRLHRSPRVADVAAHLGVSEDDVIEAISSDHGRRVRSLNAPTGFAGDTRELIDLIGAEDPDITDVELRLTVASLLARLPEREQRILTLRYFGNQSQAQIARQLGISQMHVSRLLARALQKLRYGIRRGIEQTSANPDHTPGTPR